MATVKKPQPVAGRVLQLVLERVFQFSWTIYWLFIAAIFVFKLEGVALALFVMLLSLVVALTALILAWPSSLRARISSLLIAYMGITLAFGSAHYLIEQFHPESYNLSNSLIKAATRESLAETEKEIEDAHLEARLLKLVGENYFTAFSVLKKGQPYIIGPGRRIQLKIYYFAPAGSVRQIELTEFSKTIAIGVLPVLDPKAAAASKVFFAEDVDDFRRSVNILISEILRDEESLQHNRKLLQAMRYSPTLFDFVYFSVVTGTTIGYGDILPTSRLSRMLVVIQSIISIFLAGFAVTFFWPKGETTAPPAPKRNLSKRVQRAARTSSRRGRLDES